MSNTSLDEWDRSDDAPDGDYFREILAIQNKAEHSRALPFALTQLISTFQTAIAKEGGQWVWPNPSSMTAGELAGFGALPALTIFYQQMDGTDCIIACNQPAIIGLASLLLGSKPAASNRVAGRFENQIAEGLFKQIQAGFSIIDTTQSPVIWHDYAGAKLPFANTPDSPFFVLMINRRAEQAEKPQAKATDEGQANHIRRALGQGVLNIDYVLPGGQFSLAALRNLVPGSVLPLGTLDELPLEARCNGTVIYSGDLKLSPDTMRFSVTRVLAEANHV